MPTSRTVKKKMSMKKEQLIYFQIVVLLSLDKLSFFIKNALNYRSHVP